MINYNISTSLSQSSSIMFFIISLPVSDMVCSTSPIIASVSECINHPPWDTETPLGKISHVSLNIMGSSVDKIKA